MLIVRILPCLFGGQSNEEVFGSTDNHESPASGLAHLCKLHLKLPVPARDKSCVPWHTQALSVLPQLPGAVLPPENCPWCTHIIHAPFSASSCVLFVFVDLRTPGRSLLRWSASLHTSHSLVQLQLFATVVHLDQTVNVKCIHYLW